VHVLGSLNQIFGWSPAGHPVGCSTPMTQQTFCTQTAHNVITYVLKLSKLHCWFNYLAHCFHVSVLLVIVLMFKFSRCPSTAWQIRVILANSCMLYGILYWTSHFFSSGDCTSFYLRHVT